MNVKSAFLHRELDEEVYIKLSKDFAPSGNEEDLMCKLQKALYRLKQAL